MTEPAAERGAGEADPAARGTTGDAAQDRDPTIRHDRSTDKGWLCWVALRCSQAWDFIDKRDIDKHLVAVTILTFFIVGTVKIVNWGMEAYAGWIGLAGTGHAIPGADVALVVAAVVGPWSAMASVVVPFLLSFYFKRQTT